jgi:cellobiose-specific phosphotransferase system component IIC
VNLPGSSFVGWLFVCVLVLALLWLLGVHVHLG